MTSTAPHREDLLPLIGFIAVAGPPPFIGAAAAVLLALVLAGPFTVILTLLAALIVATVALVAVAGAIVAVPYLLLRIARGHRPRLALPALRLRTHTIAAPRT